MISLLGPIIDPCGKPQFISCDSELISSNQSIAKITIYPIRWYLCNPTVLIGIDHYLDWYYSCN